MWTGLTVNLSTLGYIFYLLQIVISSENQHLFQNYFKLGKKKCFKFVIKSVNVLHTAFIETYHTTKGG